MRLYTRTKRRLAANRLAGTMTKAYQKKQPTRTAGQLGNGLSMIDGQLYNTGSTNGHGTVAVVNLGRPAAAIYKPQSNGEIILGGGGGGGCSDGGSGGVGIHALDGAYHTGTLAQSQAPWAALDSDLQDHIADPIHHTRLHDVLNADDHEIVAARYTVLGTPSAANTLAAWVTASNGTAGNVLLRSDSNGAIFLNDLYAYDKVQSQSFASGFGGSGYRLDYGVTNAGKATLEVDDLSVRRRMTVRELLIRKIRTTNGDIFVSSGGEVATATDLGGGSWTLTFREDHGFLEDDLIAAQAWTGSGVYRLEMTVTAVADTKTLTATLDDGAGDTPGSVLAAGLSLSFARHGNETDADRQGVIYLSSDDTGAPFIRVLDGIDSWAKWGDPDTLKVQMGRLDDISHAVLGNLAGYGLFGENVFLTGTMVAGGGDVALNDDGVMLKSSGSGGSFTDTAQNITWIDDVMATPAWDNISGQILSRKYGTSTIWNKVQTLVYSGETTGINTQTDAAGVELTAYYLDGATTGAAQVRAEIENGAAQIWLTAENSDNTGGKVIVAGGGSSAPVVLKPANDLGGTLGEALARWKTIYADELVVGTTYTENTGYVNDTRYYPRTELNSYLSGNFAAIDHPHAGHITATELTAELADYATIAYVDAEIAGIPAPDLSNYWTKSQADGRYTQLTTYNGHVAAANPHGTALADLTARDYDDLTNREHLLADATGLGPDHVISGATAGHVLRATDTDAARFMQLLYTDLGSRTHDIISEHSVTAAQYSVIGTPAGADTLAAWATTTNGRTNANTILRSGSSGEITVGALSALAIDGTTGDFSDDVTVAGDLDITGTYSGLFGTIQGGDTLNIYGDTIQFGTAAGANHAKFRSDGALVAGNYDADAATGWSIGPDRQIFSNVEITGTMAAAVFELGSTVVGASEQLFTAGGGGALKEPLTIDTTGGDFTYTIAVEDPKLGHAQIAVAGDWLLIQGIAYAAPKAAAQGSAVAEWEFLPTVADTTPQQSIREVWGLVTGVSDETTHYEYDITIDDAISRTGYFTFPAGTAIANLKSIEDDVGGITITGRPGTGPYLNVWSLRETGAGSPFLRSHVRVGLLESLAMGNANEYGLAAGTDLSDSTEPYIIASNERILLSNVEQRITDSAGTAMQLSADSGLDFFYTSTTEADQARRVSWVNDAETFEHFYIGPDMFYGGYLGMRVKAEDAGYYSGMHIWAGPDPADWDVGSSAEYPDDYAGLIVETPLGGDGRISIRAQSIAVYGSMTTEQIAPSAIDASGLATDSTGLATGQVYVDAAGYLRMA